MLLNIALSAALISVAFGYPYQPHFKSLKPNVDCHDFPSPLSYHIHVTYMLTNDDEINAAVAFRDEAIAHFSPFLGEDPVCQGTTLEPSGRYDNGRLCAIYDHDVYNTTIGPFAVGEWSFFAPVHYMNAVMPWFVQHRKDFTLLVHPNTGCEYEDHSIWVQWSGSPWNMDLSIFDQWEQTDEFGEVLGTEKNPTCLSDGGVCAFGDPMSAGYGPQVVCCSGSSCTCDAGDSNCYCK